jgi:hypothetical protein
MPTQDAMSTALRSTLEGSQFDREALSRFIRADRGAQERVLEDLAKSQPPQSLVAVQAALAQPAALSVPDVRSTAFQSEITAAVYWWGSEIFIPENVMQELTQAPNLLATANSLLASVLTGPLAVVLGIVAGYIAAEFATMKAVDQGRGVKLIATWFVAVLLIPSAL